MNRVILYFSIATVTFVGGVAANWSVNTFEGFVVDSVFNSMPGDVNILAILPRARPMGLPAHNCRQLIVSVSPNGALELNNMPMGTLNDTSALTRSLRRIFEVREEFHVYAGALELSSRVPEYRQIEKTVYIKAPPGMSYGDVAGLIAAVKEAGADPVGLMVNRSNSKS